MVDIESSLLPVLISAGLSKCIDCVKTAQCCPHVSEALGLFFIVWTVPRTTTRTPPSGNSFCNSSVMIDSSVYLPRNTAVGIAAAGGQARMID